MKEYAFIEKPYRPNNFSITHIFQIDYLKAIREFKNTAYYNPKKVYVLFDVDSDDANNQTFSRITEI